jgi:chromosome segregation ATPase
MSFCASSGVRPILSAHLYEGYCEIWQIQRMPIFAEFLRGIVKNAIHVLCSARVNAVTHEFQQEQHRTRSDANRLKPALEAFKRDLQILEHNWNQAAEFDAKTIQYMLLNATESTAAKIAAREVISARARIRTLEAMITSIEARIAMAEQALNGMLTTANTRSYQKRNVKQSLARLKEQRRELRSTLEQGNCECKPR